MTFAITIDAERWLAAQAKVFTEYNQSAELIAVIKSNGYGLGQANLAKVAAHHKLDRIAVGTIFEVAEVAAVFAGEIVVLEPINPLDISAWQLWEKFLSSELASRLILTVAESESFETVRAAFNTPNVVFEVRTEMNRFGTFVGSLNWLGNVDLNGVTTKGLTAHFSNHADLQQFGYVLDFAAENIHRFGSDLAVSHIPAADFRNAQTRYPNLKLRLRTGTALWLGDRKALKATGTILAMHAPVTPEPVGYGSRKTSGKYLVLSGGTAHGIGLSAPTPNKSLKQRLTGPALGLLGALDRNLSPFRVGEKKLWFVEPPHQHVSMVFVDSLAAFKIGQEIEAEVRFTTTRADVIRGFDF